MNLWLIAASALSALTGFIHLVLGGTEIARPLLAAKGLGHVPKYTMYYCWHLVTIQIAALAAAYAAAAWGGGRELAIAATLLAALFACWSLLMIALFRLRFMHFPQWLLFLFIAAAGIAGLLT